MVSLDTCLVIDCGRLWPQSCPLVLVRNLTLPVICQDTHLILYLNNTIIVYCGVASFHGDSSINNDLCSTVWYSLRFKFNTWRINWYEYLERYYFYRSYAKGDYLGDTRNRQVLPPMYARYYRNLSKLIWKPFRLTCKLSNPWKMKSYLRLIPVVALTKDILSCTIRRQQVN